MKIIHLTYCYYPDLVGGTEIYVRELCKELQKLGVKIIISSPSNNMNIDYLHDNLSIRRFFISHNIKNIADLYGEGSIEAALEFTKILDEETPDLIHMHAYTRGISIRVVREAKQRKIPVVLTYHTPTVSCLRGTLMRWGRIVCDGKLEGDLCARCFLHGMGMPKVVAEIMGGMPVFMNTIMAKYNLSGGVWTVLRLPGLVDLYHRTCFELFNKVDYIIALSAWTKKLLLRNNVSEKKIKIIRQGVNENINNRNENTRRERLDNNDLRVVLIGRTVPEKGMDIIIRAIRQLHGAPVLLDIFSIVRTREEKAYFKKLKRLKNNDTRIVFRNPISHDRIQSVLQGYHIVAVPSIWLETGPLIIREAYCAGTPVVASNLGGNAEMITHNVNGLLVEPNSVEEWVKNIKRLYNDMRLIERFRVNIKGPMRNMSTVAHEMMSIYERLLD